MKTDVHTTGKKILEDLKPYPVYKCDPLLNTECDKTYCYKIGGDCKQTMHREYAKIQAPIKVTKDLYLCPHCEGIFVKAIIQGFEIKFKYCANCGEPLDWGEE